MRTAPTIETPPSGIEPGAPPRLPRSYGYDVALHGVYEISKLLTQPARLEVTLAKVLNLLTSFLDMRHALIALLGEDGAPEVVVGCGWSEDTAKQYFDALPERAIGRIVVTQMPLVVEDVRVDPLFAESDLSRMAPKEDTVAFIGVPIKDRGHVIGTLTIDRDLRADHIARFSFDDDVRFLTMVANLLGQTVRLQRFIARDRARILEEQRRLEKRVSQDGAPQRPTSKGDRPAGIVGDSPAILAVLDKMRVVARTNSTVSLRGESGTGKELFARALHELSPRHQKPFVTLNCAALPEAVLESELFGHERGAFTGAQGQRKGRFELADGGTLFLDEIGEISAAFQAKLLRVLQLGEFERVGGTQTLRVDVRLVSATNRDLEAAVASGEFRADLYYRISVVPILLPALRDRPCDISLLAQDFVQRFNEQNQTALTLSDDAIRVLESCSFPGNVRELENCICRTATLASGPQIVADDFACLHDECLSTVLWESGGEGGHDRLYPLRHARSDVRPSPSSRSSLSPEEEEDDDDDALTDRERLTSVLESVGWVQAKAARVLGLTPRQVGYAIRKHRIPIKKF